MESIGSNEIDLLFELVSSGALDRDIVVSLLDVVINSDPDRRNDAIDAINSLIKANLDK